MFKRIAAILILSCMLFATACAQGPQLMEFIDDSSGPVSLDGLTLYFKASLGAIDDEPETEFTTYLGYKVNTQFSDMAKARVAKVESDYNVNIELSPECREDLNDIIYLLATGGGKLDANIGMSFEMAPMSTIHTAFIPMSHVSDYIDIYDSAKWGSPQRLEMFAWDGEIYGVIPNYWPELQFTSGDYILVPNIDLIKSLGQDDPRDYFEQGIWTMEKLEELIPIYSNVSNNRDETVYGYSANDRHFYEMLVQYYGADWAQKDEYGNWEAGALSEEGILAANKFRDFKAGALSDMVYFGNVGSQAGLWFDERLAIGTFHSIQLTEPGITTIGYEYAVLPFPSQDGKSIFGQYERNGEAIFITSFTDHYEEAAMILSEIYEPFEGYEDDEVLKESYNLNIFFDPRDTDIVFELAKSVRVLNQHEDFAQLNIAIVEELAKNEASAVLSKYSDRMNAVVQEELVPIKETMEKLFPGYND